MAGSGGGDGQHTPREPGWYPDPWSATGKGERYFDGKNWGTTERPLGRASTIESRPLRSSRSQRVRRFAGPVLVIVLLALGVVYVRSHDSRNPNNRTSPQATQIQGVPTTASRASGTTVRRATTLPGAIADDRNGRTGPVCGRYCSYRLAGDWSSLQLGDCMNVQTDTNARQFVFKRVSCQTPHDGEVYYLHRPDSASSLTPAPTSFADLISRVCGIDVLRSYAPRYAAKHPNPAAEAGTYGNGQQRVCEMRPDNPTQRLNQG